MRTPKTVNTNCSTLYQNLKTFERATLTEQTQSKHYRGIFYGCSAATLGPPIGQSTHSREFDQEEINKMLPLNIIEPVQTEYEATFVLATKKEEAPCVCVQYRKLNSVTSRDLQLLSIIRTSTDSLFQWQIMLDAR